MDTNQQPGVVFDAPIPGQSLTNAPGQFAWETPPQFTDKNEAAEFLFDRLARKAPELKMSVLAGAPIEAIARGIMFKGFTEGMWTPDIATLNLPILMMQIYAVVIKAGVDPEDIKIYNDRSAKLKGMVDMFEMLPEDKRKKYYGSNKPEVEMEDDKSEVKLEGLLGDI